MKGLRTEYAKAFALRGIRLSAIEGDEIQGCGLSIARRKRRPDLERIRGPQWMAFDDALGVAANDIDGGDFRPPIPCVQEFPPCEQQLLGRTRAVAATARESGKELDPRERPDRDAVILGDPAADEVG